MNAEYVQMKFGSAMSTNYHAAMSMTAGAPPTKLAWLEHHWLTLHLAPHQAAGTHPYRPPSPSGNPYTEYLVGL